MNANYNVVVISRDGVVLAVEKYDPAQRPKSVAEAASILAERLGISAPEFQNSATDQAGNEWSKMTTPNQIEPGMVEIGMGEWGFPA